jgi:cell wall assembly regulator SMI1
MSSIQDLVATWRAKGVRLEPPATESELAALEAALEARLPRDIREFYLEANGMSDLEYDGHWMSFWTIRKILSDPG